MVKNMQRNKEELIEYFIQLLGDNKVLSKIYTIEQIREILKKNINKVEYKDLDNTNIGGAYMCKDGTVILTSENTEKYDKINCCLVHELIHALSTTNNLSDKYKTGVAIYDYSSETEFNEALNEGMTDTLTELIIGKHLNDGYKKEKELYEIVSRIVGEEVILKKYFSEDVLNLDNPLDIFKDSLIEKYGEKLGNSINDRFKKVFSLSDKRTINRRSLRDEEFCEYKVEKDISAILLSVINDTISYEDNFDKKMRLIECYTFLDSHQYMDALDEMIDSEQYSYMQKIEMLKYINKINLEKRNGFQISNEIIHKILFDFKEAESLTEVDKKDLFFELKSKKDKVDIDMLYELYVNTGKISVTHFSKRNMLAESLVSIGLAGPLSTEDEIDERLSQVKYAKMGDYYKLSGVDHYKFKRLLFDKNGNIVRDDYLLFDPLADEEIGENEEDVEILQFVLPKESIEVFGKNLKNKFKEYKNLYEEPEDPSIYIIGNIARLEYNENHSEFFSIKSDGSLEKLEIRCRKKFYR